MADAQDIFFPLVAGLALLGGIAMASSRGHSPSSGGASSEGLTSEESGWVTTTPLAQTPPYRTPVSLITVTNPDGTTSGQFVRYQAHGAGAVAGGGNSGGAPGLGEATGSASGTGGTDGAVRHRGAESSSRSNGVLSTVDLQTSNSPAAGQTATWDVTYEGASIWFDPRGVYQMGVKANTTTWQGANVIGRSDTTMYYSGRYVRHGNRIVFLNGVGENAPLLARGVIDSAGFLVSLPARRGVTGGPAKLRFRPNPPKSAAPPGIASSPAGKALAPSRADTDATKTAATRTAAQAAPSGGFFGWLSSEKARARP